MMDPKALRFAADCWDKKGSKLFAEGKEEEANKCWDMAINLRLQANGEVPERGQDAPPG